MLYVSFLFSGTNIFSFASINFYFVWHNFLFLLSFSIICHYFVFSIIIFFSLASFSFPWHNFLFLLHNIFLCIIFFLSSNTIKFSFSYIFFPLSLHHFLFARLAFFSRFLVSYFFDLPHEERVNKYGGKNVRYSG